MFHSLILLFVTLYIQISWGLCVSASQANLRAKPSASSELVWTVGKFMPLLPVSQIEVKDLEGKKMWVFGSLVTDRYDCAVIRVPNSILRSGPGTQFNKTALNIAHRYMPFKKLERDGAWLHLQDDYGYKHWVYEKSLWEPLEYSQISY
jgi:hypothetical protein